jgi:hypothetical protein
MIGKPWDQLSTEEKLERLRQQIAELLAKRILIGCSRTSRSESFASRSKVWKNVWIKAIRKQRAISQMSHSGVAAPSIFCRRQDEPQQRATYSEPDHAAQLRCQ